MRGAVDRFEKAACAERAGATPRLGYAGGVNVESGVDSYLVEELFINQESPFSTGVPFTWSPGGNIAMGPLWDST